MSRAPNEGRTFVAAGVTVGVAHDLEEEIALGHRDEPVVRQHAVVVYLATPREPLDRHIAELSQIGIAQRVLLIRDDKARVPEAERWRSRLILAKNACCYACFRQLTCFPDEPCTADRPPGSRRSCTRSTAPQRGTPQCLPSATRSRPSYSRSETRVSTACSSPASSGLSGNSSAGFDQTHFYLAYCNAGSG